ncbi:MAG: hypothetical protein JWP20_713 [Roseomonas sp.]|nr:hypothetical protein [Roseomonas sp.]
MAAVLLLPAPGGLGASGQVALGLLVLLVILWISECVSPAVSAIVLIGMAVLGLMGKPLVAGGEPLGSSGALGIMLGGFSSSAVLLVAGALFLAVALKLTGLDRRVALLVMSRIGISPARLIAGAMIVGFVLAIFIPSATARVGAVIPIMVGVVTVTAPGLPITCSLGAALIIVTAQACSIFNIGIKTAAAQNLISLSFLQIAFGQNITWGSWFMAGLPLMRRMCAVLFVVALLLLRPAVPEVGKAKRRLQAELQQLGPVTPAEKRLMIAAGLLLALWSTEGWLHGLDTATATQLGVALLLLPRIGVMNWAAAEKQIPWGTVVLFAAGISLGILLSRTGAAAWLAAATLGQLASRACRWWPSCWRFRCSASCCISASP